MIERQDPKLKGSFDFLNDFSKKDEILEVFSNIKKTLKKIERLDKKNNRKVYKEYKKILNEYKDICKKYNIIIPDLDYTKESKDQTKESIIKLYNLLDRGISNKDLKTDDKKEIKDGSRQLNLDGTSSLNDKNNETSPKDKFGIPGITLSELTTISGIGNVTGKKILEYLNNESVSSIQDLENVQGVGPTTLEKIKEKVYLDENKQSKNNKSKKRDSKESKEDGNKKSNSKNGSVPSKNSKVLSKSNKNKLKKESQEKDKNFKNQNVKSKETELKESEVKKSEEKLTGSKKTETKETETKETETKETGSNESSIEYKKQEKESSNSIKDKKLSQDSKEQMTLNMANKSEETYGIIDDIKKISKKSLGLLKGNKHWLGRTVGIGTGFFNPGIGIIVLSGTIIGGGEKDIDNLKKIGGGLKKGFKKFLSGPVASLEDDNELDTLKWKENIGSFINQYVDLKVHNENSDTSSLVQLEDYVKKLGNIKLKKLRKTLQDMDKLESKKDLVKLLKKTSFLGRHDILTKYKYINNLDKYSDNIIKILKKIANCDDLGDGKIKKEFKKINQNDMSELSFESRNE